MCLVSKVGPSELKSIMRGLVKGRGRPYEALPFLAMPGQGVPGPGLSCEEEKEVTHTPSAALPRPGVCWGPCTPYTTHT